MTDMLLNAAFLPSGELIVATFGGIQRRDATGKRVLAKLKSKVPAFAVSTSGRLFVAVGNKVVEHDVAKLKPVGKPLPFPSQHGSSGDLLALSISPDESTLAGITRGDTLHVQDLKSAAKESHGGYGARRQALGFIGPRTLVNVRGNTIAEVLTLGGSTKEVHGVNFAAGGDGHLLAWNIGGKANLFNANGKSLGALAVMPNAAAFSNGLVVVTSEDAVTVFEVKSRQQHARFAVQTSGVLAVGDGRVAVGTEDGVVIFSLPGLKPLGDLPAAPVKPAPTRVVKKEKKPAKAAKSSALRTQLEELGATNLGGSVTNAQLAAAKKELGHAVPKALAAVWGDVDGFCIHSSAGGVNGLKAFLETTTEEVLWNDLFDEQQSGKPAVPLAKLKKLKVLWSLPGQAEAVGIDPKSGALFFGETNDVKPLKLKLERYLELALDPDFLEKIRDAA